MTPSWASHAEGIAEGVLGGQEARAPTEAALLLLALKPLRFISVVLGHFLKGLTPKLGKAELCLLTAQVLH